MNLLISEVQITCIFLMGLISSFLAFAISRYTVVGKVYDCARKILTCGTLLVTIHFIIQYAMQKYSPAEVVRFRTIVNLSFGIPISYFFNISNYYVLRKGHVGKVVWLLAPIFLFLALLALLIGNLTNREEMAVKFMSLLYAFTLLYYMLVQIKEYNGLVKLIHAKVDLSLLPYIRWIRWSMFPMLFIPLGFPLMTFNTDLLMRSLYGLLSISSAFFYVLSFMGYGINGKLSTSQVIQEQESELNNLSVKRTLSDNEEKQEQMKQLVDQFVKNESFIQNGITQKEAAEEMGISVYRLKQWLNNSEYKTFNRWIVYLRLIKAKKMLVESPNLTSDEIADQCGFCDRQYFQRSFRKWMGITPSQWLKEEEDAN